MDFTETGRVDMRVDLGRADVRVAEQLLDGANVGAMREHVGRETVPEDMRRSEMSRDLERDFRAGIRALARSADAIDAVALRLGAFGCRKAISRRRRKCEAK